MKITFFAIFALAAASIYLAKSQSIARQEAAFAESVQTEAAAPVTKAAGSSEFAEDTVIVPKVEAKPAGELFQIDVSSPVDRLSADAVQTQVASLVAFVTKENAIERLNADSVTPEERYAWGKVLARLLALRSRGLALEVEKAKEALEAVKAQHQARVEEYVGGKS